MQNQVAFDVFSEDKLSGKHNFFGGDIIKVLLTNSEPSLSDTTTADIAEISSGNGYTSGGNTLSYSATRIGGVSKVIIDDYQIIASGGDIGPYRYFVFANDSANGALISFVDKGASVTLNNGSVDDLNFDGINGFLSEV